MAKRSKPDRPILWLVRQPQGLVPATPFDLEQVEQYRIGAHLRVTVEQPKDDRLNRFFHALVSKVAAATGVSPRAMKNRLLLEAELIDGVDVFDGATVFTTISTADLDQAEFSDFVDRASEIITTKILPGTTIEEILDEVDIHLGGKPL